jgi:hypothetical protein
MRTLVAAASVAAALLAVPAVAAAQEAPIATVDRVTPVAAFEGRVLWSVRSGDGSRWSLATRSPDGVTSVVPVAPRRVPFDADLGPGPDGNVVAVYSRCATDPTAGSGGVLYGLGRGCDLHLFDFATGRERRLANASASGASEFWPTVWRDTIAFARTYEGKRRLPYIYTRPLQGSAPSTRQPGGARNACRRQNGRRVCSDATLSRPDGLELYGRRLAFSWRYLAFAEGLESEIRLDTIGGGHTVAVHQSGGGLSQVTHEWPAFGSGRLFWVQRCVGDPGGCTGREALRRYSITTRRTARTAVPDGVLVHDRDAGLSHLLIDAQPGTDCLGDPASAGGTCTLRRLALAFPPGGGG